MNDNKKQDILKARARKLAQQEKEKQAGLAIDVIKFQLAKESYAIELKYVKEVYPLKDYARLPGVPPFVFGLINVRRRIISVIDLRVFFDLSMPQDTTGEKVIILENENMSFAIRTDKISEVLSIPLDQIQPPPPTLTGMRQEFLKGLTADGTVILDGNKLLSAPKLIVEEK
ncbi:chemotaxis protein CheW [Candidatus Protochlamydia phocaeensis]|uniref:chemotaxis protein CheW n=1 Tax=Candidatus Protochlamydia phocaeensis TaxID=1414722 RepID=UPI000837BF52|nr:chemotaxis protein CheW [Candidatus Protochlamydia phocaeensis]